MGIQHRENAMHGRSGRSVRNPPNPTCLTCSRRKSDVETGQRAGKQRKKKTEKKMKRDEIKSVLRVGVGVGQRGFFWDAVSR